MTEIQESCCCHSLFSPPKQYFQWKATENIYHIVLLAKGCKTATKTLLSNSIFFSTCYRYWDSISLELISFYMNVKTNYNDWKMRRWNNVLLKILKTVLRKMVSLATCMAFKLSMRSQWLNNKKGPRVNLASAILWMTM